ncbi:hypothetical protein Gorai_022819 [Gossypium raimondii]|uniref:RNase H type-1 domain-containing protein n=1 Tax=Gossypium raimondii TaxID=29730 RepID=A0A7J8NUV9_GOSRA|nr:hypothetical protein [Gossypium raimondii]
MDFGGDIRIGGSPSEPHVKLNFDATYKGNTKRSYSRFVIHNSNGQIIGSGVIQNKNVSDAFSAEALSCLQGLSFAKEMGFNFVMVEGDSRSTITKINQRKMGLESRPTSKISKI